MSVHGPAGLPFRPFVPEARTAHAAKAKAAETALTNDVASPEATDSQVPPDSSSLWDLLTADERTFFSQQASLGALTYGRARGAAAAPASAPIGQRLDVRG